MKNYNLSELKQVVKRALESEYGFAPTLKVITLLEASSDATYIHFEVNGNKYFFRSSYRLGKENGVWTGKGTITREEV